MEGVWEGDFGGLEFWVVDDVLLGAEDEPYWLCIC